MPLTIPRNTNSTNMMGRFMIPKNILNGLQFFQPQDTKVTHAATKFIMKEFDNLNNIKLIADLKQEEESGQWSIKRSLIFQNVNESLAN